MSTPRKIEHSRGTSWEITYRPDGRMVRQRFATNVSVHATAGCARSSAAVDLLVGGAFDVAVCRSR